MWIIGYKERGGGGRKKRFLVEHLYAQSIHLGCYYIYSRRVYAKKEVGRRNIPASRSCKRKRIIITDEVTPRPHRFSHSRSFPIVRQRIVVNASRSMRQWKI